MDLFSLLIPPGFSMTSLMQGAVRGSVYGLMGGAILGAVGNITMPPIDYENILVWSNRFGKKTKFTNLNTASVLKEDLLVVFKQRKHNIDAFNEAFRNIQSAISVYCPVKMGSEKAQVMTATRMTNFVIRASKAMEAMHVDILVQSASDAATFQQSMMSIQLSLEEFINFIRLKSKNSLPEL